MPKLYVGLLLSSLAFATASAVIARAPASSHPMTLDDVFSVKDVGTPEISPDGKWVLYTASSIDLKKDRRTTDLWMVSWDGSQNVQLTYDYDEPVSSPKWSPDGTSISFLSARKGKVAGTQVWALSLHGGEARQLTDVPKKQGEIKAYEWSPDGQRLLLTVHTGGTVSANAFNDAAAKKVLPPIVITRYHFKEDIIGYMTAKSHTFLYL